MEFARNGFCLPPPSLILRVRYKNPEYRPPQKGMLAGGGGGGHAQHFFLHFLQNFEDLKTSQMASF